MPPADPDENRHGSEFGDDAECDHSRQREIVEDPNRGTAEKPEHAIAGREQPKGRPSALGWDHWSNGCRNDRFMNSHSQSPERRSDEDEPQAAEGYQRR